MTPLTQTYAQDSRTSVWAMESRLDLRQIFCEVDDFYQTFERHWQQQPLLTATCGERLCRSRLSLSEVMTIVIAFHGSGYRTFKEFYTLQVLPSWRKAFPNLGTLHSLRGINALVIDAVVLLCWDPSGGSNWHQFH